jgi:putative Mg2+ transporter-C (MgtC) family protein
MHVDEFQIIWRLGLALLLSSAIGVEREVAQKSAGLRTHSLVGVGSALFMLVSIFGFADGFGFPHTTLDPSRVAAQIVSGIGFIGGGIIFVRRDTVRGQGSVTELAAHLHELDGVVDVGAGDGAEFGY